MESCYKKANFKIDYYIIILNCRHLKCVDIYIGTQDTQAWDTTSKPRKLPLLGHDNQL